MGNRPKQRQMSATDLRPSENQATYDLGKFAPLPTFGLILFELSLNFMHWQLQICLHLYGVTELFTLIA